MKEAKKRKVRLEARQRDYERMQRALKEAYHRPGSLKK